ncbi:MAG: dihydropteroate synthase, partial [Thermoplasmata archaeon]|nr:dihydropteroate synthase [Thermoplasmata archaeon]
MAGKLYLRSDNYLATHEKEMIELEVCQEGIDIMVAKMRHLVFMARGLDPRAANILKQEMLSVDGEAAIPYHAISDLDKPTDCLISGTQRQFQIAIAKLIVQPFGLKELAEELAFTIKALDRPREKPKIVGILNVTPDSFSDGGKYLDSKAAIARAIEMERAGANIIDIGGESTRPGAEPVSPQEQLERVIPVIENLNLKIPISIDSHSSEVVEKALKAGASMVNLVGGLNTEMAKILAQYEMPVILMHMQGEPENMQNDPQYHDVMDEIMDWAREQIETAEKAGIGHGRIIIDPG